MQTHQMEAAGQSTEMRYSPLALGSMSRPRKRILLILVLISQLNILLDLTKSRANCFFIDEHQSPQVHSWSYDQQDDWPHLGHKQCDKKAQSPIDIQHKNVIQNNQLRLRFFNYDQPIRFKVQNAHHTIKLDPILADQAAEGHMLAGFLDAAKQSGNSRLELAPDPQLPYEGLPTIKLDWLDEGNNEYQLRDIHFHWGERKDNGSEHAIDGRRAAMEMHLVHIKRGLDKAKIGFTSDSVTVIAVLIESYRKSNADFNPIVGALTRINMTDEAQEIEYKSLNDMLPTSLDSFYTYSGSLTTPPCFQVVNWVVMSERLYLMAKQIEMFRNLYAPPAEARYPASAAADPGISHSPSGMERLGNVDEQEPALIMPNIRRIQPLNNRTILAAFPSGDYQVGSVALSGASEGAGRQPPAAWGLLLVALQWVGQWIWLASLFRVSGT